MELYIYIDDVARRVEMFNDEKVSVTSSITNYTDIGKLFTEYSSSFTIPASSVNNSIFLHWYESAIEGGFDARVRHDAYIEIDTIPFREGNVQLEKANIKNGYVESYTLTFYGNLTQLKDKFGDDKLKDLDYSSLSHPRTSTEILDRIKFDTYEVCYPLLGNTKEYEYLTGTSSDITTNAGSVILSDLFPAVRVKTIFDFIQTKYGITFTGNFLNYLQFTKLYMYMKNMELPRAYNVGVRHINVAFSFSAFPEYNTTNNTFTTSWSFAGSNKRIQIQYIVVPVTAAIYKLEVYRDNIIYKTYDNLFGIFNALIYDETQTSDGGSHVFYVVISSITPYTFRGDLDYRRWSGSSFVKSVSTNYPITPPYLPAVTTGLNLNMSNYVPDIKVADFFIGIIKMFNIIVTPVNATTFLLEPLELYYQSGQIRDLTQYIYADELDIVKPQLFKSIEYSFQKSENILNNSFRDSYNREYGDLIYNSGSNLESSTYKVNIPFENPMFEKTTGQNFHTCTFIDKNLKSYTPKPILMYRNDLTSVATPIRYYTSTGTYINETNYVRFNNDIQFGASDLGYINTINWGEEVSSWFLTTAPNGLYKRHYEQYIANLYNLKTRVLKVKARLSEYEIANIKLKDRIIIRDKRYLINTMTFDLTTNESTFELINDYRVLGTSSVGYRYSNIELLNLDNTAQKFQLDLYLGVYDYISITSQTSGWVQWTASGYFYGDKSLEITIAQNTTGVDRTDIFVCKFAYTNGTDYTYVVNINQKG